MKENNLVLSVQTVILTKMRILMASIEEDEQLCYIMGNIYLKSLPFFGITLQFYKSECYICEFYLFKTQHFHFGTLISHLPEHFSICCRMNILIVLYLMFFFFFLPYLFLHTYFTNYCFKQCPWALGLVYSLLNETRHSDVSREGRWENMGTCHNILWHTGTWRAGNPSPGWAQK